MLSTLFPPDPTLTVDNVSHIMEKVEPKERLRVLEEMTGHIVLERIIIRSDILNVFQSSEKCSTDLEKEAAAVDIYVNCHPSASWEHLASSLYHHHQVAAVEEVRSYLPPRGEP